MFVWLLTFCWVLCIWKKAATSSSLIQGNTFISQLVYRFWGASETFGGYALPWACKWEGCQILFQALRISPSGVFLQYCRLFGAAAASHTTVLFSHQPPRIQSVSASLSAPQVRRNTNQSLVQPFRKLEHQTLTLLLPPKNEASRGYVGLTARATPVSAGSLVPSHASSIKTLSQGRVTSHSGTPQKAGTSGEPSTLLFPLLPMMGKLSQGLSCASPGRGGCRWSETALLTCFSVAIPSFALT